MPAFDPVRDAVLNSPIAAGPSSPFGQNHHPSPLGSPSLGRRATHLSVLLNSDDHVAPSVAFTPLSAPSAADRVVESSTTPPTPPILSTTDPSSSSSNISKHDPPLSLPHPHQQHHRHRVPPDEKLLTTAPLRRAKNLSIEVHHSDIPANTPSTRPRVPELPPELPPPPPPPAQASIISPPPATTPAPRRRGQTKQPKLKTELSLPTPTQVSTPSPAAVSASSPAPPPASARPISIPNPTPVPIPSTSTSPSLSSSPPTERKPNIAKIPYAPKNRVSPAGMVLIPLSKSEMDQFKNYRGKGAQRFAKRKRNQASDFDSTYGDGRVRIGDGPQRMSGEPPPSKKRATDSDKVIAHYNARPEVGIRQRQDSPIIGLKNFNNWIKSVLITRFAHPAFSSSKNQGGGGGGGKFNHRLSGKVLELGIGKGGDLTKWSKARAKELVGADIAAVSVDQARSRWAALKGTRFDAKFAAVDCYTQRLTSAFHPDVFKTPFDVVSMQFCMHYAFESEEKVRCMLTNVTEWLRPGGMFIGTVPNAEQLLGRLDSLPDDDDNGSSPKSLSFGNSVYRIRFEQRQPRPIYGHKYFYFLEDAVDNVPEYLVHWDNFVGLAAEYGLKEVYKKEFHQVFMEHQSHPEFAPLMVRMRVRDENGESAMDEDQWEAVNVYVAFAFEKMSDNASACFA